MIGAGAAGLMLANELRSSKLDVCVLESGGRKALRGPDPLYEIRSTDLTVSVDSRVRALGGTTTVWSGRWKRFDSIDFEPREWVPRSGWPISHASLEPFYERAERVAGIRTNPRIPELPAGLLNSDVIIPTVFHTQQESDRNWGEAHARALASAPNIAVYLDAHLVGLQQTGRRITGVLIRDVRNREVAVQARFVVLAAGGIENARLLLLSKLGNWNDQVGRCYMDHPKSKLGIIETYEPLEQFWGNLTEDAPIYVGFRLADFVQRTERVLNSHVLLQPLFERDIARMVLRRARQPKRCRVLTVRNYLEQEPNPANRVFLSADRLDSFGLPMATVTWTASECDRRTLAVFHRVLLRELQRCGIGELSSPLLRSDDTITDLTDASHHMGTTRMGTNPHDSVVDSNCKVHDLDNLFVAGSSVFPTSGYANPTATIAALAIRLGDHLKAVS